MIGQKEKSASPAKTNQPDRGSRRRFTILAVSVAGLLLLAGAGWAIYQNMQSNGNSEDTAVRTDACKLEHVERFNKAVEPLDLIEFGELAGDIKELDNYQSSVHCMYILTRYEMSVGTAETVKEHYNQLKQLDPNQVALASSFDRRAVVDYETIEMTIRTLEARDENAQSWQDTMDGLEEEVD